SRKVTCRDEIEIDQGVLSVWGVRRIHLNALIPLEITHRCADRSAYGHHPRNCPEAALDIVEDRILAGRWDFCRFQVGVHQQHVPPVKSDRKSTRLNSSHLGISYAVFCLKKKI